MRMVSEIYTDWANHYLAKSGCPRLIKDLTQDIADGVLLAEIIQIIANEKVEDINGCPRSHTQMIENVDACLSFLEARGLNVQGLSAEEIRNGNLKTILGLFFILSRYKQQQQQQQQYYQSLVELQQRVTHQSPGTAPAPHQKTQDMQSSLTARYASPSPHGGVAAGQKKNTRLPGPSRLPAAGSGGSKVPAASNLNRRSQSFNSMDKSKPLQYCSGNEREAAKGIPAGKSWRSKSMSVKHSATSSLLSVKAPSPATSRPRRQAPPPPWLRPQERRHGRGPEVHAGEVSAHQHARELQAGSRPGAAGGGGGGGAVRVRRGGGAAGAPLWRLQAAQPRPRPPKGSGKAPGGKSLPQGKEDKARGKSKASAASAGREERDTPAEPAKKTSKIASLIPKGGKAAAHLPRCRAPPPPPRTATATTPGNGAVQLPHQQLSHPNTATVAPFMYRTCSENDCTTVAPPDPGLSGPPKSEQPYGKTTELPYGKTAKQCLEEISGEDPETRRMRTVRNIADLRQNLEETMSSLRGTQISHSTLETTFDSTVTTEVNGRGIPALAARSSPMAWRLNQSASPRLQAGDAPSLPGRFNARADDISSGYLTDGGLNLYSRNVGRAPDLAAASRDIIIQRGVKELQGELDSCDDSSSVSSGLSDTLDNISTDDLNTPSYSRTSASHRKNKESKTDAHKHSGHDSGSWGRSEKVEDGLDANMDPGHRKPSSSSSSSPAHYEDPDRTGRTTGLPVSQTGSWRRDMTAQVGITPPRTKGASGTIKTPGKTDDAKASEKGKAPPKAPPLQRSPSDAGAKSSGDEGKKPPSGLGRPAATGARRLGAGAGAQDQPGRRPGAGRRRQGPLQYRSLPRPAKSSSSAVTGRAGGAGGSGKPLKRRDAGKVGSGRSSPVALNQTDKEKVGVAEPEACLSTSPKASPTSSGQSGLRQPGSKYPDIASPTFRRLFGSKASSKASSPSTPDSAKCPSALGSPHGTLARQDPELGTGDASMASLASSPASCLSLPSAGSRAWPASLSGSSAGSKDTLSCQSMTSLHTSTESIDLPLSKVSRAGSVKSTLSEGMPLDRNTLPKKGLRYPPSSRQMSHEEGKEWLRSHSTGLQDTGSQSLLSPSGTSCTVIGKYHFSNLLSPTSLSQYSLPAPA
ncbi:hypothetical protein ANANG_G00312410 [Anguilla anguilla]|uniref:Calponin-homology (CH) domain-containing protein n=1 Tax=Anguilla anguilla TaxID=7936 RepID=A0A9D3LHA5_ANGAN|nr:hypothetical protein ANANG_G00312410 [Anguilla anguilla]